MSTESFEAAVAAREAGRLTEALREIRAAVKGFTRSDGPRHPDTAHARLELGRVRVARGDRGGVTELIAATQILLAQRGDEEVGVLTVHACLVTAAALRAAGDYARAHRFAGKALARAKDPSWRAAALNELGVIGKFSGKFATAERHYRAALPIVRRLYGARSAQMAVLWHNLGGLDHARGRFREGERAAKKSVEIGRAVLPARSLEQHAHEVAYGALLDELGRSREAIPMYRRALAAYREAGDRYEIASTLHNLAAAEHSAGAHADARVHYQEALREYRASVGAAHSDVGRALHNLATLEADTGRGAEALFARAVANLRSALGARHPTTRAAAAGLKDARSRSRRPRGARYTR
ncbi:MAG: tetratricopeptide repeat protein [Deltaproteobacteria bacterium]